MVVFKEANLKASWRWWQHCYLCLC